MLELKKKKLIKVLDLEMELFKLLSIKKGEINIVKYRDIQRDYDLKISKEINKLSLW